MLHGYLLDPANATLRNVVIKSSKILDEMKDLIGCAKLDMVEFPSIGGIYIDDEGLLTNQPAIWAVKTEPDRIMAGRALFFGADEDGYIARPKISIEDVAAQIICHRAVISPKPLVSLSISGFPIVVSKIGIKNLHVGLEQASVYVVQSSTCIYCRTTAKDSP